MCLPAVGAAQDEEEPPVRFINIEDMIVDGSRMAPSEQIIVARGGAEFESLIELRRDFIEEIVESAEDIGF